MMKIKIQKWHFFAFFVLLIIVWIVWDNEKEKEISRKEEIKKANDRVIERDKREISFGNLILSKEEEGKFSQAMSFFKNYEDEFGVNTPTTIHKAILYLKIGEIQKAKNILDSIISSKNEFEEPSFLRDVEDVLLLNNKKVHVNVAYMKFFNEYVCRIVAISYRAGMETDSLKRLECLQRYDKLAIIDQYVKDYSSFINIHKESVPYILNMQIRLLQKMHMYLYWDYWEPENAVDDVLRFKWNFLQRYLEEYDRCYGYNKTKLHFERILRNNGLASEGAQKFLVDAYLNIGSRHNKYNLSYDEFKKLKRGYVGLLVKLTPTTISNKPSAFVNAGITKPCILIKCNDWSICDSTLFTREMVLKDKGKVKKVVILKDDYTTDTIHIKEDLLGVTINYRPTNILTLDLLRHSFFIECSNGHYCP